MRNAATAALLVRLTTSPSCLCHAGEATSWSEVRLPLTLSAKSHKQGGCSRRAEPLVSGFVSVRVPLRVGQSAARSGPLHRWIVTSGPPEGDSGIG